MHIDWSCIVSYFTIRCRRDNTILDEMPAFETLGLAKVLVQRIYLWLQVKPEAGSPLRPLERSSNPWSLREALPRSNLPGVYTRQMPLLEVDSK